MGIKFVLVFPAQVRYNKKWIWTGLFFGKGEGKFDEKMENDGIDLEEGKNVRLVKENVLGTNERFSVNHPEAIDSLNVGNAGR